MTINFPKQEKLKEQLLNIVLERVLNALSHGVLLFDQKNPLWIYFLSLMNIM